MLKDQSSSLEGREQRPDAPTNKGARSHGKVRDFATHPETHQYAKGDYFTLRSGERVLRLRGGADNYDDPYNTGYYDDPYNTGYYDDPYNTGYYDDPYNTGYYDDPYNTGYYDDPHNTGYYDDPYNTGYYDDPSDLGADARRSPARDGHDQPEERIEYSQEGRSLPPAQDRYSIEREIHPEEQVGPADTSAGEREQLRERRMEEVREWIDERGEWQVFANQRGEYLEEELAAARRAGVEAVHVDDAEFFEVANGGTVNWVRRSAVHAAVGRGRNDHASGVDARRPGSSSRRGVDRSRR